MEITSAPGWYPHPGNNAMLRWWDGQAWTEERQPTAIVACELCGAGHRLPADYPGYQCTGCGLIRHFYSCPDPACGAVTALTPDNMARPTFAARAADSSGSPIGFSDRPLLELRSAR